MHPVRKQRLYLVLFLVLFSSAAIALVMYALRGNINLFYPPADVAAGKAPIGQSIRVGGMVVQDSLRLPVPLGICKHICQFGGRSVSHQSSDVAI